jgi:hypothetical protein
VLNEYEIPFKQPAGVGEEDLLQEHKCSTIMPAGKGPSSLRLEGLLLSWWLDIEFSGILLPKRQKSKGLGGCDISQRMSQ